MDVYEKIKVLYGSQTGNSEDVAGRIGRQLTRIGCKTSVCSLVDYEINNLISDTMVIFVCSTTGDGEIPDNMKKFWRFLLRKNLPSDSLCSLKFSVFGLGDSSYSKFNVAAKKLNKRLLQLGASELIPITLADDQHELGYDAAYDSWIQTLKDKLITIYNLSGLPVSDDELLPAKYEVQFIKNLYPEPQLSCMADISINEASVTEIYQSMSSNDFQSQIFRTTPSIFKASVKDNLRITSPDHFQAVHLLQFAIDSTISHNPGDVAVVWPENPKEEVEEFLSLLNVPLDTNFLLKLSDPDVLLPKIFPYPCTVRQCVKSYFDIMSVPKRSFFEFFCHFSQDEVEKEKLVEFTTAAGQEELFSYCNRPKRTILEVMQDFPHTTPYVPFQYMFDMIPHIHARKFSIASASCFYPKEFHLAVAVVNYKTRMKKSRRGLCSNWLANLSVGTEIPYSFEKGSIQLPKSENPIIMVGPGTGCAPFRAFIQERVHANIKENYLFFGCRYKEKDFLFSSDWNEFVEKGFLKIFSAFSRDQEDKCYVQHKILENSQLLFNLIHLKQAYIYVAGNAKQMPEGVKTAFADIIEKEGGYENGYGLIYIQNLMNNKRYNQETWA